MEAFSYFCFMFSTDKKPPYPFEKIAVAVAFSPRIEAILAESKRLQDIFKAKMLFVHIGKKVLQEEQYLKHLLHRFRLDGEENQVIWHVGDPVERILEVCKEHDVDLLVTGALEKESLLKYFMGSVARTLCRRAKCSILMLREPDIKAKPIKNIVVEGSDHPKTEKTIETAIYIAKQTKAEAVHVIQEQNPTKLALIRSEEYAEGEMEANKAKMLKEEDEKLREILSCADCDSLKINLERHEGKPGFVISRFARENHADLLILNSPDTKLNLIDRVFPHDIEYALADLPCDLMIIHSRIED